MSPRRAPYPVAAPAESEFDPSPLDDAGAPAALADLIDRSLSQLTVLRAALDEGVILEDSARRVGSELQVRLDNAAAAQAELARRIAQAEDLAAIVDDGRAVLQQLQDLTEHIRATHEITRKAIEDRLAEGESRIQTALARQALVFEAALAKQAAQFDTRVADLRSAFIERARQAQEAADHSVTEIELAAQRARVHARESTRRLAEDLQAQESAMVARVEGHVATARAGVLQLAGEVEGCLEAAELRLAEVRNTAGRLEEVCAAARRLLGEAEVGSGSDPAGDAHEAPLSEPPLGPVPGSLGELVVRASGMLREGHAVLASAGDQIERCDEISRTLVDAVNRTVGVLNARLGEAA